MPSITLLRRSGRERKPTDRLTVSRNTASSQAAVAPRRSTRERKATTIEIDGHVVLRKNNYTVKGLEYVFGAEPDVVDVDVDEDTDFDPREEARKRKAAAPKKKPVSPAE